MERLNYKAGEDEENVSYAYQMDPTAPENIEEQKEDAKLKKIKVGDQKLGNLGRCNCEIAKSDCYSSLTGGNRSILSLFQRRFEMGSGFQNQKQGEKKCYKYYRPRNTSRRWEWSNR